MKMLFTLFALGLLSCIFPVETLMAQPSQPVSQSPAQTLETRLLQKATFIPKSKTALEQLVEVAKHYRVPMGIEWIGQANIEQTTNPLRWLKDNATVQDLINAILQQSTDHRMTLENGIIHISPTAFATHPKNFLNLRIDRFSARKANVFEADYQLRGAIAYTLHPEDFKGGGGQASYGWGTPHVFEATNVTFSGHNLTVREILDGIALANGNALWLVESPASELMIDKRSTQPEVEGEPASRPSFSWSFTPLKELEIKLENIVVELTVKDCLSEKTVIGVYFDEGRLRGGGGGGGYEEPPPCTYTIDISKIQKNGAIVNLIVRGKTEYGALYEIKKNVPVSREKVNSYRFDHGIEVKTYVEPEQESSIP